MAQDMVRLVGRILDTDYSSGTDGDPRFCVAVDPAKGSISTLLLPSSSGPPAKVLVMYENQEISCGICLAITHLERECPQHSTPRSDQSQVWKPPPSDRGFLPTPPLPPEPSLPRISLSPDTEPDLEGFTLVQLKKMRLKPLRLARRCAYRGGLKNKALQANLTSPTPASKEPDALHAPDLESD
ncbi:hypothetical protein KC19_VG322400 [Ceratodon purpureus]|uniref:Zinc knuckle CX2CX4HX4C domain-containing protein n=1 Tax=Ceratodon purpureus TaxID=3225 RepID=A0A8T0HXF7_CERPU|nr:hypothetical protein KC19_VG322400 [Ceratodon purpureus]